MKGDHTIPLTVIGGSLGAGKTTLLRELVEGTTSARCHVIVNEIGEVLPGLGDFCVRSEDTTVLRGGCACCIRKEDLVEDLVSFANVGPRSDDAHVFLELSGIADPAPVIHTILNHPFLAHHFVVEEVVIVVDAFDWADSRQDDLWISQIAMADRCVLAKADLVSSDELEKLSDIIGQINPGAVLVGGEYGRLRTERSRTSSDGVRPVSDASRVGTEAAHGQLPDVTIINVESEFEWGSFGVWLSLLLHRWGHDVLRVKGLVPVSPHQLATVQAVHHAVFRPEHVESRGASHGQLVFITRSIDTKLMTQSLEAFLGIEQ